MAKGQHERADLGIDNESLYMTYGTSRSTSRFPRGFRMAYIHLIMSILIRVVCTSKSCDDTKSHLTVPRHDKIAMQWYYRSPSSTMPKREPAKDKSDEKLEGGSSPAEPPILNSALARLSPSPRADRNKASVPHRPAIDSMIPDGPIGDHCG